MYFLFQKISTSEPDLNSRILINGNTIIVIGTDIIQGSIKTRIEIGYPNYVFHVNESLNYILSLMANVDITGGSGPGSMCTASPGALDIITISGSYPLIKALGIKNFNPDETYEYVFNPDLLLFTEEVNYKQNLIGLSINLRDHASRQILTKLQFNDLITVLEPVIV